MPRSAHHIVVSVYHEYLESVWMRGEEISLSLSLSLCVYVSPLRILRLFLALSLFLLCSVLLYLPHCTYIFIFCALLNPFSPLSYAHVCGLADLYLFRFIHLEYGGRAWCTFIRLWNLRKVGIYIYMGGYKVKGGGGGWGRHRFSLYPQGH